MEETVQAKTDYQLEFSGKGSEFFSVIIVNWLYIISTGALTLLIFF